MHDIPWGQYYIPKTQNEGVKPFKEEQLAKFKTNKKFRNRSFDKKNCDKLKNNKQINNDKSLRNGKINNDNRDVLFIPDHESINDAMYHEQKNYEKIKVPKRNIDGIRKLGVFSHSFDENNDYKLYNEKEEIKQFITINEETKNNN